ncbi:hypothetical protein [Endozoicomonas elysicola]|uniref:Uncharacterized protein n=1 Tax=Endozoicomonas elysicola TaxID=305900 RepID=A0A081K6L7_9GAMM|nr:hypothetical protein [Endozoicomonas elysicola]KEI69793.1 hypothetical protein GV64_02705 [Endozoicomonas elysicola]
MITILIKVKNKLSAQPDSPQALVEPSQALNQPTYGGTAIDEISDLTNWLTPVIRKSSSLRPEYQAVFLLFLDQILSIIDKLKIYLLSVQHSISHPIPFVW